MKKGATKEIIYNICGFILMMIGAIIGIFLSILPCSVIFGPKPNMYAIFFVVIPLITLVIIIFGLLGIGLNMLLWKPFLTTEEIIEYIFAPETPASDFPKVIQVLFTQPYYKLATFVFPKFKEYCK